MNIIIHLIKIVLKDIYFNNKCKYELNKCLKFPKISFNKNLCTKINY